MNDRVEMQPAYCWDCPQCGRENWQRAVNATLDRDDERAMAQARECLGLDADEEVPDGAFTTYPNVVCCDYCGKVFRPYGYGSSPEEEP